MFRIASLCLVALVAGVYAAPPEQHSRIIHGRPIDISEIPYLVQLKNKNNDYFICGGSLVSPYHVVTAAHCLDLVNATDIKVKGGATSHYDKGEDRFVVKGTKHPQFHDKVWYTNDVAVLKLDRPMRGRNIGTIQLCNANEIPDYSILKVSGWGATEAGHGSATSNTVEVPVTPFEQCKQQYSYTSLSDTMICASEPGEKDACQGDSGGPAIYRGTLCGIVSWGRGCAERDYPGIYTNVNKVKKFIESEMEK